MAAAETIVNRIVEFIINPLILLVFAAGFFYFVYGLVVFLWHLREGEVDDAGKRHMIWGIVGMFIMVSAWAILTILMNTFGINPTTATDTSNANSFSPNIQW